MGLLSKNTNRMVTNMGTTITITTIKNTNPTTATRKTTTSANLTDLRSPVTNASPTAANKSMDLMVTVITTTVTSKVMVTKASQATVINNRTVTKSLMVTDTEIRIPMDIKTTDMANKLTDPDMDKTPMDQDMDIIPMDLDMDKPLMDPDMDTNNLMVMVTDMVIKPTVTDIVNLATV